ncbi:hypothetical protein BHM03_00007763 [Ensete ventricosum]|nr:hypothetical protein BHM03_00007763 [Ensete ventricosum]
MDTAHTERFVLVRLLTNHFQAVPPIGVVSVPIPPEIDKKRSISTVAGRCWMVMVDFNCRQPISSSISGGRKKKREKKMGNLESTLLSQSLRPRDPSPAGDFFSSRGENERGDDAKFLFF